MTIISPIDGSSFAFGTAIPVNVIDSGTDTSTTYTVTFVSSIGTYQVNGLALGTNYTLIPAALHGLTNLVVTATGGTTAVATITIIGPRPPTPPPSPIYTPTACGPQSNFPCHCPNEPECPSSCYRPPNTLCDPPPKRQRAHFCSPNENKQIDFTRSRSPQSRKRSSRLSSLRQSEPKTPFRFSSPIVTQKSCEDNHKSSRHCAICDFSSDE